MSYIKITNGTPVTPDKLNRYIANSGHTWVASTPFSGATSYNFNNIIDNSVVTATPALFTRIIITNCFSAAGSALFMRVIDSVGTVVQTNVYATGYNGFSANGTNLKSFSNATSVFNLGEISNTVGGNWTIDIEHSSGPNHTSMFGSAQNGPANPPGAIMYAGYCSYSTNPIRGLHLVLFGGATTFQGTLDAYQYRRAV